MTPLATLFARRGIPNRCPDRNAGWSGPSGKDRLIEPNGSGSQADRGFASLPAAFCQNGQVARPRISGARGCGKARYIEVNLPSRVEFAFVERQVSPEETFE
jgi:hypothetical protein